MLSLEHYSIFLVERLCLSPTESQGTAFKRMQKTEQGSAAMQLAVRVRLRCEQRFKNLGKR